MHHLEQRRPPTDIEFIMAVGSSAYAQTGRERTPAEARIEAQRYIDDKQFEYDGELIVAEKKFDLDFHFPISRLMYDFKREGIVSDGLSRTMDGAITGEVLYSVNEGLWDLIRLAMNEKLPRAL